MISTAVKRIALYSTTGGVGKSFIAANLASSLFQRGFTVVLCELSSLGLLPMHFGGGLQVDTQTVQNPKEQHINAYSLHKDFVLLTPNPSVSSTPAELLLAAVNQANKLSGANGVIILDIPTALQFKNKSPLFNVGLEVVSADPVSVAAVCNTKLFGKNCEARYRMAHEDYIILNKKDLRSTLSNDSAMLTETLFGDRLLGSIHYDATVSEAFAHKCLVGQHSSQSQAAADINELTSTLENLLRPPSGTIQEMA